MIQNKLYYILGYDECVIGKKYMPPREDDFPAVSYKWADFEFAYKNTTDYVRSILDAVELKNDHKHVLVDIKVHSLKRGQCPALRKWHIDCSRNPLEAAPSERHNLFIGGDENCLTQFVSAGLWVNIPEKNEVDWNKVVTRYNPHLSSIKPNTIVQYTEQLHRAVPAENDCKRLLVRVTETSNYSPQNKFFRVTIR